MLQRALLLAAAAGGAFVLWTRTDAPLGWACLWIGLLLLVVGVRGRRRTAGKLLLNLGLAAFLLGALEVRQWAEEPPKPHHRPEHFARQYVVDDDVIGYAPRPNSSGVDELWLNDERIYTTEYTIDGGGVRVAPPAADVAAEGSVLCFGGSFMFGEGLANDETVPWRAQEKVEGRYRFYNFGLHGYGPHQMLALLESGRAAEAASEPPRFAVYWSIHDHARRAAGKAYWDLQGPRYEVGENGEATRVGTFQDLPWNPIPKPNEHEGLARYSWLVREMTKPEFEVTDEDVARWVGIVRAAQRQVEEQFPGCEFHVLFDDRDGSIGEKMLAGLEPYDVRLHRMSAILPGYPAETQSYRIHERDVHPSDLAADIISTYVAENIVGSPSNGD